MNKNQLLQKLDKSWRQLKESYGGMTASQMTQPGADGGWSVKDMLAHVTTWEEEALRNLPLIMQGQRPPRYKDLYGGIDAFNALMTENKRSSSLAEILDQMEETHQQLVNYISNVPDDLLISETRFRRRLRLDTYSHYPVHTKSIMELRSSLARVN